MTRRIFTVTLINLCQALLEILSQNTFLLSLCSPFNFLTRVLAKKSLNSTCASFTASTLIKHNSCLIDVRGIECTVPGTMVVMHTVLNSKAVTWNTQPHNVPVYCTQAKLFPSNSTCLFTDHIFHLVTNYDHRQHTIICNKNTDSWIGKQPLGQGKRRVEQSRYLSVMYIWSGGIFYLYTRRQANLAGLPRFVRF